MTLHLVPISDEPDYSYGVPSFVLEHRLKYIPEMAERAADMAAVGATPAQIAERLGVTKLTLDRWMNDYPEFHEALKLNMGAATERVKRALYQRAVGYEYVSEEIKVVAQGDGVSAIERVPVVVHVPADASAALNWLKKCDPDTWGDKAVGATGVMVMLNLNYSDG